MMTIAMLDVQFWLCRTPADIKCPVRVSSQGTETARDLALNRHLAIGQPKP
jgi:hypothetical protein